MTRQEANKRILNKLSELIEKYPDQRFGQLLVNTNIVETNLVMGHIEVDDPFNDESTEIYYRMLNSKFCKNG